MVGGTLETYVAGSTTPATTWQDAALTTANTNPITLDARGECVLWLDRSIAYKFVLKNAQGVIQWTQENSNIGPSLDVAALESLGVYRKGTILGGVSQFGGMPTGAVIESGSNANGRYIKWADGTLICTHEKTYPSGPVTALGAMFITNGDDIWTYPLPFVGFTPRVFGQVVGGLTFCWVGLGAGTTGTEFNYRVLSPVSSVAQPVVALFAIGRWF
jgi:hypothetical protein